MGLTCGVSLTYTAVIGRSLDSSSWNFAIRFHAKLSCEKKKSHELVKLHIRITWENKLTVIRCSGEITLKISFSNIKSSLPINILVYTNRLECRVLIEIINTHDFHWITLQYIYCALVWIRKSFCEFSQVSFSITGDVTSSLKTSFWI